MTHRIPLRPLLSALCGVLLIGLVLLWLLPGAGGSPRFRWTAPPAQPPALDGLAVSLPPRAAVAPAAFGQTLQRPLFTETRRPAPLVAASAPAAAVAPAPEQLEKAQLLGVMKGAAFTGVLVRVDDKVRTLRRGEAIGPWALRDIRDREVVFTHGDVERVLKLDINRTPASAAAPSLAGRPAASPTLSPQSANPVPAPPATAAQPAAQPPAVQPPAVQPPAAQPPAAQPPAAQPPAAQPAAAQPAASTPPSAAPAADPWTTGGSGRRVPAGSAPRR